MSVLFVWSVCIKLQDQMGLTTSEKPGNNKNKKNRKKRKSKKKSNNSRSAAARTKDEDLVQVRNWKNWNIKKG